MTETATCRAAVFRTPDEPLRTEEFPIPELGAGEALVRVDCCTLCGSDIHSALGHRAVPVPTILGHEIVGRVAGVAPDNPPTDLAGAPLSIGDRVVWSVAASCGQCDRCAGGMPQKCRHLFKYGHEEITATHPLSGGLAEFCHLAPGTPVVRVDDQLSDHEIAPVSCATATVAEAMQSVSSIAGRRVLIFGAGMLGLTAAAMARWNGASEVAVCDVDSERLERARNFGATSLLDWESISSHSDSADVVFELSGAAPAVEAAVGQLSIGGELILVGSVSPSAPVSVDPERIVRQLLRIRGVHNYTPESLSRAVTFLSETEFRFGELVEQSFPLEEINEAIAHAVDSRACRVAIAP
jgi:putative phosphonate catabolism associated alcohol dehydrogenase